MRLGLRLGRGWGQGKGKGKGQGEALRKVTWYMLPAGATCSMISFLPAYAPTLPKARLKLV